MNEALYQLNGESLRSVAASSFVAFSPSSQRD